MSDGSLPQHTTALPSGYVLETYRIERMLGEGGFGITYLATDVESGKRVAIKELLPKEFATRTHGSQVVPHGTHTVDAFAWSLDSFMNEARTLAGLSHGNVVQIQRLFQANGTAYMVMDYVDGQSLNDWLKSLAQPPDEAQLRGILMPLLDGLEHVHSAGLLHRDIKPDNIFITKAGKPVLLDFGSARPDVGKTQTMTSLVSAGYSPMEQYLQKSRQGPASDLYALAASMVRAMTGEAPTAAIDRSVDATLQLPVAVSQKGRYGAAFLRAVDAAFEVQAAQRPQSVAAWRGLLDGRGNAAINTIPGPPTDGGNTSLTNQPLGGKGKHAGWFVAATATLLAVGVVAGFYFTLGRGGGETSGTSSTSEGGNKVVAMTPGSEAMPERPPAPAPVPTPPVVVKSPEPTAPPIAPVAVPQVPTQPLPAPVALPAPVKSALDDGVVGKTHEVELPGGVKMTFCYCPPGEFMMGSPASEAGRDDDEDQVRVSVTKGYWLARTEVTQGQWAAVAGTTPAQQKAKGNSDGEETGAGTQHPMYFVSWEDAAAFIEKMNARGGLPTGWKWALPTEAQWEYGCRAGTTTTFSFGNELNGKEANCDGEYPHGTEVKGPNLQGTREVGSYRANGWGLYDMHGNAWEWCGDWHGEKLSGGENPSGPSTGVYRVRRGGSWYDLAVLCRAAFRSWLVPGVRSSVVGFRPALVPSGR